LSKAPKAAPQSAASAAPAPGASVDQIRDIIFGQQMAEYETRFAELEKRLLAESKALHDEIRKRFAELESRLADNSDKHDEAANDLARSLEQRAKELSDSALRDREALENALADARHEIAKRLEELTAAKTDREALSQMLRDVAGRLENGDGAPAAKSKSKK